MDTLLEDCIVTNITIQLCFVSFKWRLSVLACSAQNWYFWVADDEKEKMQTGAGNCQPRFASIL